MGYSLIANIQAEIDKVKDCDFLPDEEGGKLIVRLAEKFSFDLGQRWLWDSSRQSTSLLQYAVFCWSYSYPV